MRTLVFKFIFLCVRLKILKALFSKITFTLNVTVQTGKIYLGLGPGCCIHHQGSPETVIFTSVKMEPVTFHETSVVIYQNQRRHTPQELYFHVYTSTVI